MDGFKNSTKTQYSMGGYAKGGSLKGAAKVGKVMGEFKAGTLHSGSKKGPEVTNPKQAIAIGLSEAHKAAGHKKGGSAKGPSIERSKSVSTKSKVTPTMNAQEVRRMEKYKTAMASRPNRQPVIVEGKRTAAALTPIIRRAMAAKAAQAAQAAQASAPTPPVMDEGAAPMGAPAMGPPAMKKGGKARFQVMRKAEGGAVVGYDVGGAVNMSFTPPSPAPAGQRWIQRDDGAIVLVSTDPNATYTGRSGATKRVSDLSIYQGGMANRPAANFVTNDAPDVLANLRSVGGLNASYDVPDAGEIGNRQNAQLSFTPPGVAPAGQRYVQRDDGAIVLVSTDPNATYTGRSGATKNVSDLSIYQGGNAYIPAANFVANDAPDVLANLRSVGGLDTSYMVPTAGRQPVVVPAAPPVVNRPTNQSVPIPEAPPPLPPRGVDPRALAETYRASVPGYSYGEAPAGERQFFNYALAPGASPPWMAKKRGGAVSASKASPSAQKYAAAMASRPNREPMIKRDMGGMASSTRSTKDYHKSDADFVASRGEQLNALVGKKMAKGGEGSRGDLKQDKAMIKAAVHKHERHDHPGKPLTKLRKGGTPC